MKRGYNELVGLQATLSRVTPQYELTHYYQWRRNGKAPGQGTLRGYSMRRYIPAAEILRGLRDAYASAILAIWQQVTKANITEYYQLHAGATPQELELPGHWQHWAEL